MTQELSTLDQLGSLTEQEAATVAAAQAAEATVELLRFIREGAYNSRAPFGEEVVGKLAEALKIAIDIEGGPEETGCLDEEERDLMRGLHSAVSAFIAGWVG